MNKEKIEGKTDQVMGKVEQTSAKPSAIRN